ncbi:protein SHQ1 homolog isoform X3 [Ursus arctos]|uniref:protein SHQ1 homolog isoform X3 n=1 Tax=Ursus arctos TaxID=9644 RepID=UPI002547DD04|nr:protein SHQ1 homolog isoform X3 [Ursus arctos]
MLTPAFDLSQDPDFLTVAIRVPYARVSEFDVYFEGVDFKFYAKPYFLRLTLPGRVVENGSEQGSYDTDKGIFTIRLPKETPGQHFEGLNMLTALLAPRKSRTAKPLVEEIGASEVSEGGVEDEDEEFDWEIEQSPYEEASESALSPQYHYGFGNLRSGVFQRLQDELSDVIDIKDPDFTPATERRQKRLAAELAKFDPDHYLADFFEDEAVEQVLKYNPWWSDIYSEMMASLGKSQEQENHAALVSFSEEEKYQLRKFVNKSYLLDKRAHCQVYYSLIDILLAYCYETRVTEGEKNVESAWNIRKLSPTLCWFETWTNVHEILVSFGRRVLCYPLYRHFKLVMKAYRDTIKILQLGKSAVLKCLLDVHKIFQENDPAYILNDLYISDYCVWIQKAKNHNKGSAQFPHPPPPDRSWCLPVWPITACCALSSWEPESQFCSSERALSLASSGPSREGGLQCWLLYDMAHGMHSTEDMLKEYPKESDVVQLRVQTHHCLAYEPPSPPADVSEFG